MIALVAGATGLTGAELVKFLEQDERFKHIYVLSRWQYQAGSDKIIPVFFKKNISEIDGLPGALPDIVFCCLGTTIKKAGSQEAFRFVDVDLVGQLIEKSEHWGSACFVLQSAVGAGQSTANFYLQCKTEVEAILIRSRIPVKCIIRPSLLLGKRNEQRFGESAGKILASVFRFMFVGRFKRYKPVPAKKVAFKMLKMALIRTEGIHVIESEQI